MRYANGTKKFTLSIMTVRGILFDGQMFPTIDSVAEYAISNRKEGIITEMIPGLVSRDIFTITYRMLDKTPE